MHFSITKYHLFNLCCWFIISFMGVISFFFCNFIFCCFQESTTSPFSTPLITSIPLPVSLHDRCSFFPSLPHHFPSQKEDLTPNRVSMLGHSVVSDSLWPPWNLPAKFLCSWNFPGRNGVGFHFLLQEIFPTQGSNPSRLCLLHWQRDYLSLALPGKMIRNL